MPAGISSCFPPQAKNSPARRSCRPSLEVALGLQAPMPRDCFLRSERPVCRSADAYVAGARGAPLDDERQIGREVLKPGSIDTNQLVSSHESQPAEYGSSWASQARPAIET